MNIEIEGTIELTTKFYLKNGTICTTSMGNMLTGNEFSDKFILQQINYALCQTVQNDKPITIDNDNLTVKFTGKDVKRIEVLDDKKVRLTIDNFLKEDDTHTC